MDISSSYKENNSSRHKTMEDFTNNFIKIYMENNYSIVSKNY